MSILESMRSGTDSTFMQVVLALVVVTFVFWYAAPQADVTTVAANVNGTRIMGTQVDRELRLDLRGYTPRSDEEWAQARRATTDRLVARELVRQAGVKSGLVFDLDAGSGMSRSVALSRRNNPNFHDAEGNFDEELYRLSIKQMQYTEDEFDARLQQEVITQKMATMMSYGVVVPDQMLLDAYVQQETRARVRYVRLRPSNFNDQVAVDPEAVAAWMSSHPGSVEATYATEQAAYQIPETVEVRMIALKLTGDGQGASDLRPRLLSLREQIEASSDPETTMAELARKWSEHITADDGGSIGVRPLSDMSDDVIAGIAGLEAGQMSDVVFTDNLGVVYRVVSRSEARTQPLEEVQEAIAQRLMREEQTPALAAAFAEELRTTWSQTGSAPTDTLTPLMLGVQTSDYLNADSPPSALAPPLSLVKDALNGTAGEVLPQVYQQGDALYVAVVDDIEQADLAAFTSERDAIRRQVVATRRQQFLNGWIEGMKAQANL